MKTEKVLNDLANAVHRPASQTVTITKESATLILNRVNHLEGIAAALLRSQLNAKQPVIIDTTYAEKPTK
jgi:hypothetical protein